MRSAPSYIFASSPESFLYYWFHRDFRIAKQVRPRPCFVITPTVEIRHIKASSSIELIQSESKWQYMHHNMFAFDNLFGVIYENKPSFCQPISAASFIKVAKLILRWN